MVKKLICGLIISLFGFSVTLVESVASVPRQLDGWSGILNNRSFVYLALAEIFAGRFCFRKINGESEINQFLDFLAQL
jgi:hypothetical protein